MSMVPDKLINYRAYSDTGLLLGTVDVELPKIKMRQEELSGSGIAGVINTPCIGQFDAMPMKIKFRALTHRVIALASPRAHHMEFRGSVQFHESGSGLMVPRPIRVVVRALPDELSLGKLEAGKAMDTELSFELTYLAVFIDELPRLEIDKLNHRWLINGDDPYILVAKHLGVG